MSKELLTAVQDTLTFTALVVVLAVLFAGLVRFAMHIAGRQSK